MRLNAKNSIFGLKKWKEENDIYKELNEIINKRLNLLNQVEKKLDCRERIKVNGRLRIDMRGDNAYFYHVLPDEDPRGKYIRKDDIALAAALAQKGYNEQMAKLLSEEKQLLKKLLISYPTQSFDTYLTTLSPARQQLISPIWLSDEEYIKQWLKQNQQVQYKETSYITNSGIYVKSKSEINIGNTLDKYNLPYIYELPHYLEGMGWVKPDFTILLIETREIKIWEHHGLLDEKDYRENNFLKKNNAYIKNGFFPGKNLIQTFESQKTPLSTSMIEAYIEEYLLQ